MSLIKELQTIIESKDREEFTDEVAWHDSLHGQTKIDKSSTPWVARNGHEIVGEWDPKNKDGWIAKSYFDDTL